MSNSIDAVNQPLSVVIPLMMSCVLAVIFNTTVCYLIATVRSLKTATNVFIFSLCLCDMVIAGILLPVHCYFSGSIYYGYLLTITILVYICNLTAVTSERLFSITYPLKYIMIVTKKRTTVIATLAWVVPILYSLLPLIWNSDIKRIENKVYTVFTLVVFLIGPLIFVCITYIKVCVEIKKMLSYNKECKGMNMLRFSPSTENVASEMTLVPDCDKFMFSEKLIRPTDPSAMFVKKEIESKTSLVKQLKLKMSELRSSTAFGIVAITYMMNWIPVIILTFLQAIGRLDLVPPGLSEFSIFVMAISSLVDALIYALFLKNFRKTIKLIIRRFKTRDKKCMCFI